MTDTKQLKDEELEQVSGSYKKVDTGGYEFANGDCFKQGKHMVLRVRKHYCGVDGTDMVACQRFGQHPDGTYYYIEEIEVPVNLVLRGDYLGYDFVVRR